MPPYERRSPVGKFAEAGYVQAELDTLTKTSVLTASLAATGLLANIAVYQEPGPLLVSASLWGLGHTVLALLRVGGRAERVGFNRAFAVGLVMSGLAAAYAVYGADQSQLMGDAASFYALAADPPRPVTLDEVRRVSEGALAVRVWSWFYDAADWLGLGRPRYVGVFVNALAVALGISFGLRAARYLPGPDRKRLSRFLTLSTCSGVLSLFAALHLRDAFAFLAVSALSFAWVRYLTEPRVGVLWCVLIPWNVAAILTLGFIRAELTYLPVAMLGLAGAAVAFSRLRTAKRPVVVALLILLAIAAGAVVYVGGNVLQATIARNSEEYRELSQATTTSSSLGTTLVVNQPTAIRAIAGSLYLVLFPVPFWAGLLEGTVYHLFKSLNAVAMYFTAPLLVIAIGDIARGRCPRPPQVVFIFGLTLAATVAVAITSLETRHWGAFFMPVLLLASYPNSTDPSVSVRYRKLLLWVLAGVSVIHGGWIIVKLTQGTS